MPTAMSWRQVSATIAGDETTWGTPGRRLAGESAHPAVQHLAHDPVVHHEAGLVEAARGADRHHAPRPGAGHAGHRRRRVAARDPVGRPKVVGLRGRGERGGGQKLEEGPAVHSASE
jgi:hypothetical protein